MASYASRLCGVALLVCALPALHAQGKVTEKSYRVQGHAALQLHADDASVHATSCGGCSTVQVRVDFHDADPSRYDLKESQSGSTVSFELKRKPMSGWFSGWAHGPEITVQVPTDADTKLSTGSGSVALRGVHGQQELHSGSGSINADEIDGSLQADTGSGSIHLRAVQGSLGAHTGSGTIDADGRLRLRRVSTGSGSVHLVLTDGSTLDTGALVETGSGSVDIRMPSSSHAELRVSTGSGGIHCDLPVTVQGEVDKHALHGMLNGGGPTLRVSTGSGSVSIKSL